MRKTMMVGCLAALFIGGCADSHKLLRQHAAGAPKLKPGSSVYVAMPRDGSYGDEVYRGSGNATAQVLFAAFSKHTQKVDVATSAQTRNAAMAAASAEGAQYLAFPSILHWEDRATEWSAIPDKVEVKIEVIEIASGKVLDAGVVSGKSGLATFGGDHPQDLLPAPTEEFVMSLY